jgi:NAD(P)-dependent dehydrogenase (short-subunit alcohol dehydrogenase family)
MYNPMNLAGRRILVTGASSGIGRACAIALSKLGATLVVSARRRDELEKTLSLSEGDGHAVELCDVSKPAEIAKLAERAGRLDGLIHSAGVAPMVPVGLADADGMAGVFDVNCFSFIELMKHYSKEKNRNGKFSAVAVSSVSAFAGWAGGSVYCASKGALSAAVRSLAVELAPKGIRVNAICPSNVKTPLYEAGAAQMNDGESLKTLLEKQPLGLGMPDQIADVAAFLVSDASRFVTGVNLPVDGGYLAR